MAGDGNGGIQMDPFGDINFIADINGNTLQDIIDLGHGAARPDLGDVSKGQLVTVDNFFLLFKDILNPKQLEGLRLLVTPFPQQQFNATDDRRSVKPHRGVSCFDCHANGHTNGATHLVGGEAPGRGEDLVVQGHGRDQDAEAAQRGDARQGRHRESDRKDQGVGRERTPDVAQHELRQRHALVPGGSTSLGGVQRVDGEIHAHFVPVLLFLLQPVRQRGMLGHPLAADLKLDAVLHAQLEQGELPGLAAAVGHDQSPVR